MKKSRFSRLKGLIVEKNMTQKELAKKINMTNSALNRRLNELTDFTASEINKICAALEIPDDKIRYYFFP